MYDNVNIRCCECSADICVPRAVFDHFKSSGREFYCYNGHVQSYRADNAKDKQIADLKLALEREQRASNARMNEFREQLREVKLEKNKCADCTRRFESPGALKRHRNRAHGHLKALPANAGKSN